MFYIKLLFGLAGFPLALSSWEHSMASQSLCSRVCHENLPPSQRELRKSWYSSLNTKEMLPNEEQRKGEEGRAGRWAAKSISQPTPQAARFMRNYPIRAMLGTKNVEEEEWAGIHETVLTFTSKYGTFSVVKLLIEKKPWFCYKISLWHQWVFAWLHICICILTPPSPITAHNSLKTCSLSILAVKAYTKTRKTKHAYSCFHRDLPSFELKILNNSAYLTFIQGTIVDKIKLVAV